MENTGADAAKALIVTPKIVNRPLSTDDCSPTTAGTGSDASPGSGANDSPESFASSSVAHCVAGHDAVRKLSFDPSNGISLQNQASDVESASASVRLVIVPESQDRVYWEAFFVNMPMFCGYAALFGLQHEIKTKFGINDNEEELSKQFGVACSFLYIFNLIFRFSHNILFGAFGPRIRTCIAMTSMMASMLCIVVPIFIMDSTSMYWVMLAYALGGVAVGTFEANFLCCLTPLGPKTKHLAITAIPFGITAVLVGAFLAMGPPFGVPVEVIYLIVAGSVFSALLLFLARIPVRDDASTKTQGIHEFVTQIRQWRQWLPVMWSLPFATAIDMFMLSAFSPGVALYLYDTKTVEMCPGFVLNTHDFFVIYNLFNMFGGLCGRFLSYRVKPRHPLLYTILSISGAAMLLTKVPMVAPLSTFIVMMGDGLIYGSITRRIDSKVPKEFNLIALSFWLFVGDFGSVAGSNLISYIRVWVVGN